MCRRRDECDLTAQRALWFPKRAPSILKDRSITHWPGILRSKDSLPGNGMRTLPDLRRPYTIPWRNSSSGYFVPRHTMPSFQRVINIERSSVKMNIVELTGCRKK